MRKYAIPHYVYILITCMLIVATFGHAYAYFSATAKAVGSAKFQKVSIAWYDANDSDVEIVDEYTDPTAIQITSPLRRGEYTKISAVNKAGQSREIKLALANLDGTVSVYCRIKIEATYVTKAGETKTCTAGWVQLALGETTIDKMSSWKFEDGYYYYKSGSTLTQLSNFDTVNVADRLYLSPDAGVDMYGSTVTITLKAEAIQTTNNAHATEWA